MRTAVVLVNYHGSSDTKNCINSLLSCSYHPQLVVVDNSPNDQELNAVVATYPDAKLIRAPRNLGFGGGNNMGINWILAHTNCEFIFVLNNDTTVEPDTITKLEATLDNHHEAGIATPRIVFMDKPDVLWYGGGEVSWLRGSAKAPGIMGPSNTMLAMQAREVSFASGCALLIRRKLMDQLGGFDERFFMYEEDVELCLRSQELGWKIRYEPTALVLHISQASSRESQGFVGMLSPRNDNLSFYAYHLVRNRLINMRLHARGKYRLIFIFGFSLLLLKKMMSFAWHQRWHAIVSMFRGWHSYRACFERKSINVD